mmetsp:Transcript_4032/g.9183  ORF Transcript_4032/g.9183 Transcript_4032/m.9183 type:complete len:123 (-) Transcript_4032:119-487(-)
MSRGRGKHFKQTKTCAWWKECTKEDWISCAMEQIHAQNRLEFVFLLVLLRGKELADSWVKVESTKHSHAKQYKDDPPHGYQQTYLPLHFFCFFFFKRYNCSYPFGGALTFRIFIKIHPSCSK